jgi:hypothetical protein
VNENMPFRFLLPISKLFENGITDKKSVYRKRLIKFPRPEFIVLYNGTEKCPDRWKLQLSDAFLDVEGFNENNLELTVKVFNINKGHNEEIVEKCKKLSDYAEFVDLVRKYQKTVQKENPAMGQDEILKTAIISAIGYCKENNILTEFWDKLTTSEVNMLAMEYDRELELEVTREEAEETGKEIGKEIEREQIAKNALRKGFSPEVVHEITGLDTQTITSFSIK